MRRQIKPPKLAFKEHPPLDAATELALVAAAQRGDLAARNRLIEQWLPFLIKRATPTGRQGVRCNYEPIYLADAVEGFCRGIEQFDASLGFRLMTYADRKVRAWVQRARRVDAIIRHPHVPRVPVPEARSYDVETKFGTPVSTLFPAPIDADPTRDVERFRAAMARLPERLRDILVRRMNGETLEMIGRDLGIVRERVRQLEADAMSLVRSWMLEPMGDALRAAEAIDPEPFDAVRIEPRYERPRDRPGHFPGNRLSKAEREAMTPDELLAYRRAVKKQCNERHILRKRARARLRSQAA